MPDGTKLLGELVRYAPEALDDLYENHLGFYDEPLPQMFFWDMVRSMVGVFESDRGLPVEWQRALDFLEGRCLRGGTEDIRVIVTSFLASLPFPGQAGYGVVEALGPCLRARLDLIRPAEESE